MLELPTDARNYYKWIKKDVYKSYRHFDIPSCNAEVLWDQMRIDRL